MPGGELKRVRRHSCKLGSCGDPRDRPVGGAVPMAATDSSFQSSTVSRDRLTDSSLLEGPDRDSEGNPRPPASIGGRQAWLDRARV